MKNGWYAIVGALLLTLSFGVGSGMAADVDVYAEGAYTGTNLVLYIYADINGPNILSAGVKVVYPDGVLSVTGAEKNNASWYMGAGGADHPYMEPETSTDGEVVIILGKLDTGDPTAGVSGDRVILGKIVFSHTGAPMPPAITLGLGRAGDYDNFVATDGTVMDATGVAFTGVAIYQRGDANGDGVITNSDFIAVRDHMNNNMYRVYADCNDDGVLTNSEFICIRNLM